MKKLPARYMAIVMPFLLSVMMSGLISMVMLLLHGGVTPHLMADWLKAWAIAWVIAFPSVLCLLPVVRRLATLIVETSGQ
ncbi:DUF2798 domain-containing protein [Asticcacaulis tiandongensis]|uniref:DUF2798 domain-containing protein n=1 Tax=Asticcacaulis tiandongensis TaxID=2565365 RepID=UPI00112E2547|nr:DUF2798 domain-containing protein [Asticcacaulis tiandongensis]